MDITHHNADPAEDVLIEARDVSLSVPVFQPADRQLLANPLRFIADLYLARTSRGVSHLLNGINLSLHKGERLGVVGVNGAGKSTLLRCLAGIYRPTTGTLVSRGDVRGLFDISLGMNPEATGLENIYMRALQLGFEIGEIRDLVPQVLEFSELDDAIEKPLNTYSTGMRLRLAVAVSTLRAPDVLLLDEWIGTGDARFREKIRQRMDQLVEDSRGLVLATHNTGLMRSLCTRGIVVHHGEIVFGGPLDEVLDYYRENITQR